MSKMKIIFYCIVVFTVLPEMIELYDYLGNVNPEFSTFCDFDKFKYIMSSGDDKSILQYVKKKSPPGANIWDIDWWLKCIYMSSHTLVASFWTDHAHCWYPRVLRGVWWYSPPAALCCRMVITTYTFYCYMFESTHFSRYCHIKVYVPGCTCMFSVV